MTLINSRFVSGVEKPLLTDLLENHELVITLEAGILDGRFGEKISRFYSDKSMNILNYGAMKEFTNRANLQELYDQYHLKEDLIVEDIKQYLN